MNHSKRVNICLLDNRFCSQ